MDADPSTLLSAGFVALSVITALAITVAIDRFGGDRRTATRFAAGAAAWMIATGALAGAGILDRWDAVPPPVMPVIGGGLVLTLWVALSGCGRALAAAPWAVLIGLQGFRIAVELLIHLAVREGVAPPQLTWSGYNLDIFTGVTAIPVAVVAARGKASRALLWAWNGLGLALLAVVVNVAALSMPTPVQVFAPDNTWIGRFPFVWLPAVLVAAALLLHVATFRKLLATADQP